MNEDIRKMIDKVKNVNLITESVIDEIGFVFQNHPTLAEIGSPQEYLQYINSIFPSSKVKEILYHGSNAENIDKFRVGRGSFGTGVYLQTKHGQYHTGTFGKNVYSAIINSNQPFVFYSSFKGHDGVLNDLWLQMRAKHEKSNSLEDLADDFGNEIRSQGYDSLKIQTSDTKYSDKDDFYYLVYNPDNIHILGSNKDIEGFRSFKQR
jgi:hypothetical protein